MEQKVYKLLTLLTKQQLSIIYSNFSSEKCTSSVFRNELLLELTSIYENMDYLQQHKFVSLIASYLGHDDLCEIEPLAQEAI